MRSKNSLVIKKSEKKVIIIVIIINELRTQSYSSSYVCIEHLSNEFEIQKLMKIKLKRKRYTHSNSILGR